MSQDNDTLAAVRLWTPDDYPTFVKWWTMHGHEAVPMPILPTETGFVLERGGAPTCAIFAYRTVGLGVATMRWSVGEPGKTMAAAHKDFDLLFEGVKRCLLAQGYNVFFADAPPHVHRYMKRLGFTELSRGNVFSMLQIPLE